MAEEIKKEVYDFKVGGWNKSKLGLAKFYWERWRTWLNLGTIVMTLIIGLYTTPVSIPYYIVGFIIISLITIFDLFYIYPREAHVNYQMNPSWNKLEADIAEIKRLLNERK